MSIRNYVKGLLPDLWRAAILVVVVAVASVIFNRFRESGIPLVATEDYQIFVPCPETGEEAEKVTLADLGSKAEAAFPAGTVLIDARSPDEFGAGHIPGALNVVYDELEGVSDEDLARLKGMADAKQYVVYCDGWPDEDDPAVRYDHPPSEHLADELKSMGLSEATSLEGGLKAYLEQGGKMEK